MKSTIKEIADELRANGELDEGKLRMLEKDLRKTSIIFYSWSALILLGALVNLSFLSILLAGGIIYYLVVFIVWKGIKESTILTHLFTNGVKHKGILHSLSPSGRYAMKLDYSTVVRDKKFLGESIITHRFFPQEDHPELGAEIDIIYDKSNPSLFRFYSNRLANHFCIRKHKGNNHD